MKKLYKNNFAVLISSLALSSSLIACTPNKINNEQIKKKTTAHVIEQTDKIEEKADSITKESDKDKQIEEYIINLKKEILELREQSKEKWNSEETQEKIKLIKQKSKDLFDFVFNGKEINGITFKDLSEEGKQITKERLYEIDRYIDLLIPDYKERFHDWTVDKGADAIEKYDSLKQWYQNYKEETLEEYNSRKVKSK